VDQNKLASPNRFYRDRSQRSSICLTLMIRNLNYNLDG